ncbi:MAG: hypothetical protein MR896_02920 [Clostridiales bacterium]|nr:hypothetical protein [Clostridiales bacterium]
MIEQGAKVVLYGVLLTGSVVVVAVCGAAAVIGLFVQCIIKRKEEMSERDH